MSTGAPDITERGTTEERSRTILLIAMVVIALIAVLAAVLSGREVETLDSGSPEGVVQEYLQAVLDGDEVTAHGFLSAEFAQKCSLDEFGRFGFVEDNVRVVLREVSLDGEAARVEVSITESGGLGDGGWTDDVTFRLERSGETWVITRAPWPYGDCGFG
jgi:hypothetical protein